MQCDLRKAEDEDKWRENANNREQWNIISRVSTQRSLTRTEGKKEEEQYHLSMTFMLFKEFDGSESHCCSLMVNSGML